MRNENDENGIENDLDDEEDEDDEDDYDDDREDDEDEGDADEEDEDEDDDDQDEEDEIISQDQKDFDDLLASGKLGQPTAPVVVPTAESWKLLGPMCQQPLALGLGGQAGVEQADEPLELSSQDLPAAPPPPSCACHHCVTTTQEIPVQQVFQSRLFLPFP